MLKVALRFRNRDHPGKRKHAVRSFGTDTLSRSGRGRLPTIRGHRLFILHNCPAVNGDAASRAITMMVLTKIANHFQCHRLNPHR